MDSNLTNDISLTEILLELAESRERHLGVALPGIVMSYDSGAQTATIQPAINRLIPDVDAPDEDVSEMLPAIQSVPIIWPRGRNFSVAGTLTAGDPVLLVCIDQDMAGWRSSGQLSDPVDVRTHDWSSAVAIPGLLPAVPAFQPPPLDAAALASKVLLELNAIVTKLNLLTTAFLSHTHTSAAPGSPTGPAIAAPPPTPAPSPSSVASGILKLSE